MPSAGFEPASTRGHKEANPAKTRGRYDLPLIPTKADVQTDVNSLHDWSPVRTRFQVAPTG